MRCFLAVELPEPIRVQIAAAMEPLQRVERGIKWVPRGNLHLTLKFLDEIQDSIAESVADTLQIPCSSLSPFEIEGGAAGTFPSRGEPRVLWLGLGRGEAELANLAFCVEGLLEPLGFPRETRPFQAHLTVGRARDGARLGPGFFETWKEFSSFRFGRAPVDAVTLFRSDLTPQGAIYTAMRRLELGRRNA